MRCANCIRVICLILCSIVKAADISAYVASRLHLVNATRYQSCPFHAFHSHSFACYTVDTEKTERIIRSTSTHFINGRSVFPMLTGQNLLFTGDSLVRNQFNSLACILWEADSAITLSDVVTDSTKGILGISSKLFNVEMHFVFTGSILEIRETKLHKIYFKHNLELFSPLKKVISGQSKKIGKPTALIISAGHHFDMSKYSKPPPPPARQPVIDLDLYAYAMDLASRRLQRYSDVRIIWRSVPPRHYARGDWNTGGRCDSQVPCPSEYINNEIVRFESNYWKAFQLSSIVQNVSQKYNFEYLDISPFSMNRCDAMVGGTPIGERSPGVDDCSHYCVPGVPDTWNAALMRLLLGK